VAADDRRAASLARGDVEPRHEPGRRLLHLAFHPEVHHAVGGAEAHARHRVHDHPEPIHAPEAVVPGVRLRAVELGEKEPVALRAQLRFYLGREVLRLPDRPRRQEAGVDHHVLAVDVQHRPEPQPVEQIVAVRCIEQIVEGVVGAPLRMAGGEREEVQIVVALHDDGALPEIAHEPHHGRRVRPAVHQVADEPEAVARARESDLAEQALERLEAGLDVADRVGGHGAASLPDAHYGIY